jgi:hypothetical protein
MGRAQGAGPSQARVGDGRYIGVLISILQARAQGGEKLSVGHVGARYLYLNLLYIYF